MNWQPIETAPKDGTRMIMWDGSNIVFLGIWDNHLSQWISDGRWLVFPTHWMPLPEPPKPRNQLNAVKHKD